ncbi:hypothetical protein DFR86_01310 [Acidianus sulfidivorans JP7]|uniref:Uncharacterized protein n=1 Tax=Acidianus sulfidivorans JP7 TaxID=619593 RepID=A0A2U9IK62_9CREN|nr:hypothetical protein [Acidianus sulfidivorans]AWR96314.1 hypothetical protein DFR86_01310 [Acidianus sulfidivorans JP7]
MKLPSRSILLIFTVVFFIVISLPLDFLSASAIGVENTTILAAAIYMILTGVTFLVIFLKDFY